MPTSTAGHVVATLGLAVALFIAACGTHVAMMPRGSLAAAVDLRGWRKLALWTYLYFAFIYCMFATSLWSLHPPMGKHWSARACMIATVAFCLVLAELFLFAAATSIQPDLREVAGWIWLAALLAGTTLAPLMTVTLVLASRQRRLDEERKVRENLAFLGEGR